MKNELNQEIMILNEESIRDKIYIIRGEKVMLDFELAEIYGYSTKAFNQQVKNNREKFEGYMFKLTEYEVVQISRSKNLTSIIQGPGMKGGRTSLPYAFTESGIYMLMTVLRGSLATEQSRKLINIFRGMKDYIETTKQLTTVNEIISLTSKVYSHEKRLEIVENEIDKVKKNFVDESKYIEFHIMDGERIEADVIYQSLYKTAKQSIIIIDNYIGVKTLKLLKICSPHINITIISDNMARDKLENEYIEEFINETGLSLRLVKNNNRFHDRYIVIDYNTFSETVYHSGSSSKDSGNKITSITKLNDIEVYNKCIREIIENN